MILCRNCGQENADSDLFCRKCGVSFREIHSPPSRQRDFESTPPRPYSWKTGEFRDQRPGARETGQIDLGYVPDNPFRTSELPARVESRYVQTGYRCPHCGTTALPIVTKKVSTAGWVAFSLLLVFTLFLFWIGLLLQEEVRICSVCKRRVG